MYAVATKQAIKKVNDLNEIIGSNFFTRKHSRRST